MVSPVFVPVANVSNVTDIIIAAAQAAVILEINKVKALIPDITQSVSASHPDYDLIDPQTAVNLRAEIDALIVAIDAAPIA